MDLTNMDTCLKSEHNFSFRYFRITESQLYNVFKDDFMIEK